MKLTSFFRAIVIIILAVFICYQVYTSVINPIKTENTFYYTAVDDFKITGLIFRNEVLVKSNKDGVMHFTVDDGNRVAKNAVIANVYDSEEASITLSSIDSLKEKIADMEDILSYNDIGAANLDLINAKISDKINGLVLSTSTSNFQNISQSEDELLSVINRKNAALGLADAFSDNLKELKKELKSLNSSLPKAKGSIKASQSGYFVSKTDGFEKVFTCKELEKITPEFLEKAEPKEQSGNIVGKIVSDYEWYIVAEVSINESLSYKEGEELKIVTSVKSSPELPVTVKKINISESTSKAVVIFACNEMNSELASMRSGPMSVVKNEYSGLKVSRKALRVVDTVKGVYVVNGMQLKFVPIEIIYSTDDFLICDKQSDKENYLKLYDRVVVKGKNVYDGKIIS